MKTITDNTDWQDGLSTDNVIPETDLDYIALTQIAGSQLALDPLIHDVDADTPLPGWQVSTHAVRAGNTIYLSIEISETDANQNWDFNDLAPRGCRRLYLPVNFTLEGGAITAHRQTCNIAISDTLRVWAPEWKTALLLTHRGSGMLSAKSAVKPYFTATMFEPAQSGTLGITPR